MASDYQLCINVIIKLKCLCAGVMDLPLELWVKIALDSGPVYNLVLRSVPQMGRAALADPNFIERRYILRSRWCRAIVLVVPFWESPLFITATVYNMWLLESGCAVLRYST